MVVMALRLWERMLRLSPGSPGYTGNSPARVELLQSLVPKKPFRRFAARCPLTPVTTSSESMPALIKTAFRGRNLVHAPSMWRDFWTLKPVAS